MLNRIPKFSLYVIYFIVVKYFLNSIIKKIYQNDEKEINYYIKLILILIPVIVRLLYKYFKSKSSMNIPWNKRKSDLYKLLSNDKFEQFISFFNSNYASSIKELENEFYLDGSHVLLHSVQNNNFNLLQFLLKHGFNVNLQNLKNGETALHRAIHFNKLDMVKAILEYKPDFETLSFQIKMRPMNLAVMRNKEMIVDLLLSSGDRFSYNEYLKSYASKSTTWNDVNEKVKRVIAKNKCKCKISKI